MKRIDNDNEYEDHNDQNRKGDNEELLNYYELFWFNGRNLIQSHLPSPINSPTRWSFSVHVHHVISTIVPLTVCIDFAWADRELKPLFLQFHNAVQEHLPINSVIPCEITENLDCSDTHLNRRKKIPSAVLYIPGSDSNLSCSVRFLVDAVFIDELKIKLSIFRLMKVLAFDEAEFYWHSIQFDSPAVYTITKMKKLLNDHFVEQLLKQW